MNQRLKNLWALIIGVTLFTFACVTINIYFPAEKVESVAGEIVNDIRGQEREKQEKGDKTSLWRSMFSVLQANPAWAEEPTTVSNPTIRALKDRLRANYQQMKPFYAKGAVVESNSGYVSLGNTQTLDIKEKRDLNALVTAENSMRKQLYEEVAKALKIDLSQVGRIGEIFAREWQKPTR
ncbi:MAG: DUF1318 domain-containing protein [Deltaproteobacteria bacterium]